ncbi:Lsr2 family protein [Saccharopolyspora taberi]|uniref:Lsr2 family protein n=1 Tax=Saccharopolyspora taberi TaxID=60895 RepID=A0ABN3VJ49_9PSEU
MAERIQVELVDDIDGSPAQHTVTFALDGVTYEIDLSERNAQRLRGVFERYISRARTPQRVTRGTREQEREEREARQANRQLTEQIRGAAQRTRERLSQKAQEQETEAGTAEPELPALIEEAQPEPKAPGPKDKATDPAVPAVSLPQFSSAVD